MKISNILLVANVGAERSRTLLRAAELARKESANLTVCDVVEFVDKDYSGYMTAATSRRLIDVMVTSRMERLQRLIASAGVGDLEPAVKVLVGKPHVEIAGLVRTNHHDLVIKAGAGNRGMRILSASREDRNLIRSCPCPVWLVNAAEKRNTGSILVALDVPSGAATDTGLNEHILEVSRAISLAESRRVHIVHAWRLTGERHLRGRSNPAADLEVDRMVVREAAQRKAWLRRTASTVWSDSRRTTSDNFSPVLHVLEGPAKKVIPDLADTLGAGLIVMGSAARTGVHGLVRGNTSEKIIPRSNCSVVVVKPPAVPSSAAWENGGRRQVDECTNNEMTDISRVARQATR